MTLPNRLDDCPAKLEGPGFDNYVIASPRRGVAISWYNVQILT